MGQLPPSVHMPEVVTVSAIEAKNKIWVVNVKCREMTFFAPVQEQFAVKLDDETAQDLKEGK